MGKTRQTFSKEFKAKIALEALREESTIQQLSVKYRVPSQGMCAHRAPIRQVSRIDILSTY